MSSPVVPFRQFVLKVHSRCDLACDHCYVYEHADQSWLRRPKVMSPETVGAVVDRIREHAIRHRLDGVNVVLHGGEPLLAGPERLDAICAALRAGMPEGCDLDLRIHTNGVRLDERFLDVFARHRVTVGVSIDGDRAANDRHRRFAGGRSSYDQVVRAVGLLRDRPALFGGLLCTVDVANDPIRVYEALLALRPPRVDFLLPHATWDTPPSRPSPTAYADWLTAVHDRWEADGRPMGVRLFESLIRAAFGMSSLTEAIGLDASALVVVETDGTYEQVDSLKVAYEDAPATGYDVFAHSLDEVAGHPGVRARQTGIEGLCDTCRGCPVVEACGGGLYPHRHRSGNGFDNPSVYCADLFKLITHVRGRTAVTTHAMPVSVLDALAGGYGGAAEIAHLSRSQDSYRRMLVTRVAGRDGSRTTELLTRLDAGHREALDAVLAHPYVRAWAVACLRGEADRAYLGNVVAAAALRAGLPVKMPVLLVGGAAHLPTVGTLVDASGLPESLPVLVAEPGGPPRLDGAETVWHPARRLVSGDMSVLLEDGDPHRDCHEWPAAPRLDEDEAALWQVRFDEAWRLIQRDYPAYVPALRTALTTLTPLSRVVPDDLSSTARDAFGAVAAALPGDPATLALLILHEFQHVKLGAILDLLDLYDPSDRRLFYAPWRDDPRPLEGLLQGTYAHLAVTDFWRLRRHAVPDPGHRHFARWRAETARAVETLAGSGALTPLGERFVERMRQTMAGWLAEPVPGADLEAAARAAGEHAAAHPQA
ncbi:FxsB family radical SAM/SPASM domain protein [Microbispora sp. RL4-1S]|uniref:FxsB family radical SAM/SPASM domain protein n=1 Tax=Microbispora oryzae TaxID=2806554 RepID=A0A941AIM9_9ACTN|nr:FxsB family cyclophane-forming radical SAM/SPASM peptide maturase [Microbispora oryzae]MBP2704052.1 FxsB family radical SAM/SPASM domain protein [Microbispora oryzae]